MSRICTPTRLQLLLERKSLIGLQREQEEDLFDLLRLGRILPTTRPMVNR